MNGIWRKLWPNCVKNKKSVNIENDECSRIHDDIAQIAASMNIEGMELPDITELIESHEDELTNDDLLDLQSCTLLIHKDSDRSENVDCEISDIFI